MSDSWTWVPQPDNLSALAYRRISELDLGFNR